MLEAVKAYATAHPWLTFFLVLIFGWGALQLVENMQNLVQRMWVRFTRMVMVLARGWPPAHLDADGDWKPEPKKEEAADGAS